MSYQSETVATIVNRLNLQYFLPAIQREFVWEPEQITTLFDSLMRNYPIGSLLLWELKPENHDRWQVYRFMAEYRKDDSHNQLANTNGVQQLTLALDGQQRLTALLIGLKGHYSIKKKYLRWDNPDAWVTQRLYLDLLKDPAAEAESDVEIHYAFRFSAGAPQQDTGQYWFEVGKILNYDGEDAFDRFCEDLVESLPDTQTKGQISLVRRTLRRLWETVWRTRSIAFYTEHDQDYDRVLDIFVRANQGGTRLSKSDMLLSMVTAKWGDMNAREEIHGFVDRLNDERSQRNNLSKDFVMKTCLVLCDLPVTYKVENFNNQSLTLIHDRWVAIKSAMERGIDFVNAFGINRDTLSSANALIPLMYYMDQHPNKTFLGTSTFEVHNASEMRQWFLMALLNNVFGGSSDTLLILLRRALHEGKAVGTDFPVHALNEAVARHGGRTSFGSEAIATFLNLQYGKRETFLALSLLTSPTLAGSASYQQDHIFPSALFKRLDDYGFDAETKERYLALTNRLGNLELLSAVENQEKSNRPFEDWLVGRDHSFLARHLIPEDPTLRRVERFEDFIRAREALIRGRLTTMFATAEVLPESSFAHV